MNNDGINRREMLALLAGMAPLLLTQGAKASPIDTSETLYTQPGQIKFVPQADAPPKSLESAYLYSTPAAQGLYYTLLRWYPGYMSGPHSYASDRLCVVVSGSWWINSGADFDLKHLVRVPPGTFVRRVARTWHYDGVPHGEAEPVVIAICGTGPVDIKLAEPDKPLVRAA
ncbi:cupin domain-containing protein [Paraburkholderia silviterrae]|uniref:Tat pathway signal sequence n=1 Tax=Paraburkholderia silviterrae TaxID=2528715 RepID=A0A4R5M8H6_9BURK|nr:cupin domain-containing protein [Paraburkholderia silviterrae]TDG22799.1 tat pathway signal sequence [Paraburkholderia silviterrae]